MRRVASPKATNATVRALRNTKDRFYHSYSTPSFEARSNVHSHPPSQFRDIISHRGDEDVVTACLLDRSLAPAQTGRISRVNESSSVRNIIHQDQIIAPIAQARNLRSSKLLRLPKVPQLPGSAPGKGLHIASLTPTESVPPCYQIALRTTRHRLYNPITGLETTVERTM